MLRRLAQQRMTLSELTWSSTLKPTSSASCAISAVAEFLVYLGRLRPFCRQLDCTVNTIQTGYALRIITPKSKLTRSSATANIARDADIGAHSYKSII